MNELEAKAELRRKRLLLLYLLDVCPVYWGDFKRFVFWVKCDSKLFPYNNNLVHLEVNEVTEFN